ncbi:MAG: GNAT family N-acetyltransferase [Chloroflexota bacterium]|nr:GNAT family N-acetyltransferase [Chloroflexota bacterium]
MLDEVGEVDQPGEVARVPAPPATPPQTTGPLRVQFASSLEAIRDEWDSLALASRNVFATYEWISTWYRHFGASAQPITVTGRDGAGQLVALVPLFVRRQGPLHVIRFAGSGPAGQLGPVSDPAHRQAGAVALRGALDRSAVRWDVFLGTHLAVDEGWTHRIGGHLMRRQSSPVLRPGGDRWDRGLVQSRSTLLKEMRRTEQALAGEHALRYRLANDAQRLPQDLDRLFALHRLRWRGESPFSSNEAFHRDFAAAAFARGWLRLRFLELDGDAVAASYTLRYAGRESGYQFAHDPRSPHASLETLMLIRAVSKAFEEGVTEYAFLRGAEPHEHRLANVDAGLATVAIPHTAVGTVAVAVARAAAHWR